MVAFIGGLEGCWQGFRRPFFVLTRPGLPSQSYKARVLPTAKIPNRIFWRNSSSVSGYRQINRQVVPPVYDGELEVLPEEQRCAYTEPSNASKYSAASYDEQPCIVYNYITS